jgi:acetylornithine/succinyldiaminopimelate/putrescine aminotransferase
MDIIKKLSAMRERVVGGHTVGLSDETLRVCATKSPDLERAVEEAYNIQTCLIAEFPHLAKLPEDKLIIALQAGYVNFYPADQSNPYVPVAAAGPWIVSFHGAVIHDSGGYGMIGFGHAPEHVLKAMSRPHVMANIMTANFSQERLFNRLQKEIGHTRGKPAYHKFICMNSGSESVTVACRISDINAKKMTDPGGRHAGKKLMFLTLKGGFHGRTEKPAQLSNSSIKKYQVLASFRGLNNNHVIEPNSLQELEAAFKWADQNNVFFESMFIEPVMGEGDPGKAITPEFYALARKLTHENGSLLVVDSIQAAIRAYGVLSICDYPGFQKLDPPDMETYSKAINAGQYPVSILAMTEKAAGLYVRGVYGNTKTTNPRALDVSVAVFDSITPELRRNICERGVEFLDKFKALQKKHPKVITKVQGTGLLFSVEIAAEYFDIVGYGALEEYLRVRGIGVIHGGENSLRFTPHFEIASWEVDLIVDAVGKALLTAPAKKKVQG